MKTYTLHRTQSLPVPVEQAWRFFSDARNLATITPPSLGFVVLTPLSDAPVYSGMAIDYTVRPLFGIPLRWTTEIVNVDAPHVFTDRQAKGPYALWEHTHTFTAIPGGTLMTDDVKYALPLGVLGTIAHTLVVKKKLDEIFGFRNKTLIKLFGEYK